MRTYFSIQLLLLFSTELYRFSFISISFPTTCATVQKSRHKFNYFFLNTKISSKSIIFNMTPCMTHFTNKPSSILKRFLTFPLYHCLCMFSLWESSPFSCVTVLQIDFLCDIHTKSQVAREIEREEKVCKWTRKVKTWNFHLIFFIVFLLVKKINFQEVYKVVQLEG